jgi:hypothetical protein
MMERRGIVALNSRCHAACYRKKYRIKVRMTLMIIDVMMGREDAGPDSY